MVCVITKPASMQQDFLNNHSYNSGLASHRKGIEKIVKWIMQGIFSIRLTKHPIKALL